MTTAAHRTPLSASSADKLATAVGAADDAVDAGATPDAALAKAAGDAGVPVGHVPFLVRAYNTGRAVRQLGETDPWEKAADYPIASIPGVLAALTGGVGEKRATDTQDGESDYFSAPSDTRPRYVLPPMVTGAEKKASAYPREEPEPAPRPEPPRDQSLSLALRAGHQLVKLADELSGLTPAQYRGVKQAAEEVSPAAAAFAFPYVEAGDPWLRAKGAADCRPDPLVTTTHPAVRVVAELGTIRNEFPKKQAAEAPYGCSPVTLLGTPVEGWYARRPIDPIFGLPVPDPKPTASAAAEKIASIFDPQSPTTTTPAPGEVAKRAGFGGDVFGTAKSVFNSGVGSATRFGMPARIRSDVQTIKAVPDGTADAAASKLDTALSGVDEHAAIQSILADPRFVKADPQTLVQTYRDLSQLAPTAMQNPAVASDFLTRKLQTGPLGYHDLEALTRLEKNLNDSRKVRRNDDDDDTF